MAIPTVFAVGAQGQTNNAGGGTATPGLPAGTATGDLLLLFMETGNQPVSAMSGWSNVGVGIVQQATGVVTALTIRWKIAGAGETAPAIAAGTIDHIVARIVGVRGHNATTPINITATGVDNAVSTSTSIPGATTTVANCLVFAAFSTGTDVTSTAMASAWTNASLASPAVTEQCDNWHVTGNGGGFGVAAGGKATAGAYNATTVTIATANTKALMSFAVAGAAAATSANADVATGTGTANGPAASTAATADVAAAAGAATIGRLPLGATEDFESYPTGSWAEQSIHGPWLVEFLSAGTAQIIAGTGTDTTKVLRLESQVPTGANTFSALVTSEETRSGDVDFTIDMRTTAQLRATSPNLWEVAWLVWNFVREDATHVRYYYVALKPGVAGTSGGFELGKVDQAVFTGTGGQRFLWTDTSTVYAVGSTWHTVRVQQTSARIQITVDGVAKADFTDGPGSGGSPAWGTAGETVFTDGGVGLYEEDARVEFDNYAVTVAGGTATAGNGTGTGTALDASASIAVTADIAAASGAGLDAAAGVAASADVAAGTAAGFDASAGVAASAAVSPATGAGFDSSTAAAVTGEVAVAVGSAFDATVAVSGATSATGDVAAAAGASLDAAAGVGASAGVSTAAGSAWDATAALGIGSDVAAGAGSALDASAAVSGSSSATAGPATGAGSAFDAAVSTLTATSAAADIAAATGAANPAAIVLAAFALADVAAATGAAWDAAATVPVLVGYSRRGTEAAPTVRGQLISV